MLKEDWKAVPLAELDQLEKDAARWRWLAGECDGEAQDVFTTWLARTHEPKEGIDAKIDEAMKVPNAPGKPNA